MSNLLLRIALLPLAVTPDCVLDRIDNVIDFGADLVFGKPEYFEYKGTTTPDGT